MSFWNRKKQPAARWIFAITNIGKYQAYNVWGSFETEEEAERCANRFYGHTLWELEESTNSKKSIMDRDNTMQLRIIQEQYIEKLEIKYRIDH